MKANQPKRKVFNDAIDLLTGLPSCLSPYVTGNKMSRIFTF